MLIDLALQYLTCAKRKLSQIRVNFAVSIYRQHTYSIYMYSKYLKISNTIRLTSSTGPDQTASKEAF